MKNIRKGVFETNSSSTHCLTLQTTKEFENSYYYQGELKTYDKLKELYSHMNFSSDYSFKQWFEENSITEREIENAKYYDFEDPDELYNYIIPYKWLVENYSGADLEIKKVDDFVAVSLYIYE